MVHISIPKIELELNELEILDVNGKTVKTLSVTSSSTFTVDLSQLGAGLFICTLNEKDKVLTTKKVIIQQNL